LRPTNLSDKAGGTSIVSRRHRNNRKSRLPEDSIWLAERRAFDLRTENAAVYRPRPRKWHSALTAYRDEFDAAATQLEDSRRAAERSDKFPEDRRQLRWGGEALKWRSVEYRGQRLIESSKAIAFRVSLGCFRRALALTNTIAFALERRGFNVTDDRKLGRLVVSGHGADLTLRIIERLEQKIRKVKASDGSLTTVTHRLPTGVLKLSLYGDGRILEFIDQPKSTLEVQLPSILDGFYHLTIHSRIQSRKDVEEGRQRKEADGVLARVEEKRRGHAVQHEEERRNRKTLIVEARQYDKAAEILTYVEHIQRLAHRKRVPPGTLARWMAWAKKVAAEHDPTAMRLNAIKGVSHESN
jgi:hypothetical protein